MAFKTLYDLASEKVNYINGPQGLAYVFLIIGVSLIGSLFLKNKRYKEISKGNNEVIKQLIIGIAFIILPLCIIYIFVGSDIAGISKAQKIINRKLGKIVEGKPENYHPMPKEGHDHESFDIEGVHFEYSDNALMFGYNNAASLGGVIHPNNYYRITYYEEPYHNGIIKIEIRNDSIIHN